MKMSGVGRFGKDEILIMRAGFAASGKDFRESAGFPDTETKFMEINKGGERAIEAAVSLGRDLYKIIHPGGHDSPTTKECAELAAKYLQNQMAKNLGMASPYPELVTQLDKNPDGERLAREALEKAIGLSKQSIDPQRQGPAEGRESAKNVVALFQDNGNDMLTTDASSPDTAQPAARPSMTPAASMS